MKHVPVLLSHVHFHAPKIYTQKFPQCLEDVLPREGLRSGDVLYEKSCIQLLCQSLSQKAVSGFRPFTHWVDFRGLALCEDTEAIYAQPKQLGADL